MQVKCLRVLQYFPVPEDPVIYKGLEEILKRIITGQQDVLHRIFTTVGKAIIAARHHTQSCSVCTDF